MIRLRGVTRCFQLASSQYTELSPGFWVTIAITSPLRSFFSSA